MKLYKAFCMTTTYYLYTCRSMERPACMPGRCTRACGVGRGGDLLWPIIPCFASKDACNQVRSLASSQMHPIDQLARCMRGHEVDPSTGRQIGRSMGVASRILNVENSSSRARAMAPTPIRGPGTYIDVVRSI